MFLVQEMVLSAGVTKQSDFGDKGGSPVLFVF